MTTDLPPLSNLAAGQKLGGAYVLDRPLDVGGGQTVWLAQDEVLGKEVSLHFLPAAVAADAGALDEIRQEVKRNRPLIHPCILRVYDLVEGEGWAALATDAFEGRRLSAILEEKKRFEVRELEDWLDQTCVALEEAHRLRITHRDLAPENIFITPAGKLLLANFAIGRICLGALKKAGALGVESSRWSSLSPQSLDDAAPVAADDVYGTGALFYQLIAGQPVFSGPDVPAKIRGAIPARLSEVRDEADDAGEPIPPGWENVIAACLNKSRDERPGGPSEIVSSIEAYAPAAMPAEAIAIEEEEPIDPEETVVDEAEAAPVAPPLALVLPEETETEAEPPAVAEKDLAEEALPVVAEAASIEKEPEPVAPETKRPAPAPVPPRPVKLYDTDDDAFSAILPKRFRFPAAIAAAVIFVLFLINGAFKGDKEKTAESHPIATTDPAEHSELTAVKNTSIDPRSSGAKDPIPEPPAPAATVKAPAQPAMVVAAAATPKPSPSTPPTTGTPAEKQLAEKAAALEKLKADLATAETAAQARAKEQQAAEAALAEAAKNAEAKTKAAAAARKEVEELATARKQREDEQKAADLAAQAAQQLAAEKLRAAEDARKALKDFEAKNRDRLAAQDKSDSEIQALQRTVADRQRAADDLAKAAAAAAAARQQQLASVQQAEQELQAARATVAKSAEAEQHKQAVDSERRKLDDEIAAMRVLFEQKMKDIEDRRRQLEGAAAVPASTPAPKPPTVVPAATPVIRPPAAVVLPTPVPTIAPAPGLPLMASRAVTTPSPAAIPPSAMVPTKVDPAVLPVAGGNSLGMRFAPVGDVQFCIWQTRWKDFEAYAKAVNLKSTAWRGPGFRQGPDHPVVNVTWNEAVGFCKWLTDQEHKDGTLPANQFYRLPYDLEWSKAVGLPDETGKTPEARDMGIPDVYPWGTDWPPPKGSGNYTGEETGSDVAIKGYDDGFAWTSPVGSFPPNKLGLYDMGGNVWQWCMDAWNADSKARVLRGASWYNGALKLSLLSSCRVHALPDSSTDNYGFRIVRATESPSAKPARK